MNEDIFDQMKALGLVESTELEKEEPQEEKQNKQKKSKKQKADGYYIRPQFRFWQL